MQQSNPTEVNASWIPNGDDVEGYAWSYRAYDWQDRLTVFTNQDQTTRQIIYDGCGCAGGYVVELVDEMNRRRDQTFDALGRMWRERVYNWGGSNGNNVYTTTTNTYNIRGQITNTNVLENASGVSQNTVMTYDGHGRLKTRQLPIYLGNPQSATPYTSYEYYNNDTLMRVTDPRGARTTYGYNGRHLMTGINYDSPAGVAPTPNVVFEYDEAGKRTVMDDGPGRVTYTYDQLSRMTSETRVVDSISRYIFRGSGQPYQSTFTIGYSYNLGGMVTQIMTPTGDTIDYAYDKAGRTTRVSGTPRDGVTDYITDIKYRAWDAAKQVSYGYSNYSITAQFNSRMLISRMDDQSAFGAAFGYDPDGRIKTVEGLYGPARTLDRSLSYDHVGRLTQTRSGSAAGLGGTEPEQLRQNYTYDAFNQMSTRSGGYWYRGSNFDNVFSATYINGRGTNVRWRQYPENWQYDVAGNIKSYLDIDAAVGHANLDWDAAGRMVKDSHPVINDKYDDQYEYDGDGSFVSKTDQKVLYGCQGQCNTKPYISATYNLRSTVLSKTLLSISIHAELNNGQYLIEKDGSAANLDVTGRQLKVYANGVEVAVRNYDAFFGVFQTNPNQVLWQHRDPHNTIAKIGYASTSTMYSVDPAGTLVKTATQSEMNAYWGGGGGTSSPPPSGYYSDYSSGGYSNNPSSNPFGSWGLSCYLDGIRTSCGQVINVVSSGSAYVDRVYSPTGRIDVPGLTIVADPYDNSGDSWESGPGEMGGTLHGSIQYKVHVSSLFSTTVWEQDKKRPNTSIITLVSPPPTLKDVIDHAVALLNSNEECRKVIGESGADLLKYLYKTGQVGIKDLSGMESDPANSTHLYGSTFLQGKWAMMDLDKHYFMKSPPTSWTIETSGNIRHVILSKYDARLLILLHELSHATGEVVHDESSWLSRKRVLNNEQHHGEIVESCFPNAKNYEDIKIKKRK